MDVEVNKKGIFKLMPSFLTSSLNKSFIGSPNLNLIFLVIHQRCGVIL